MTNIFKVQIIGTKPRHYFRAFINLFKLFPKVILVPVNLVYCSQLYACTEVAVRSCSMKKLI